MSEPLPDSLGTPPQAVMPSVAPQGLQVSLAQVNALMAGVGSTHLHAVAEQLLRLVGAHVPLAQCTIFSFERPNRPRIVAMGDRSRTSALPRIAQAYVTRFFRLDPALAVVPGVHPLAQGAGRVQGGGAGPTPLAGAHVQNPADPRIILHRQRPQDIAHAEYRQVCYELPQVAERLALLARYEGRFWMSVNFYRGVEHGPFDDAGVAIVQAFAPTIQHAVRLHHTGHALQQDLSGLMQARAARRNPSLTQRDHDVLASLLKGQTTEAMAESLGLTVASAQTYVKRLYRKLGLSGQRELLAWLMEPGDNG
ncbi:MAG: helix-turn-helix transcriptional regulator [Burkholderiales bacterium]|nr:helix-turn-helix transcriptional regulator [Burkholderiales bacterium]